MSFLSSLFGGDATKKAARQNTADLRNFQTQGNQQITEADTAAQGYLGQATSGFDPWVQSGQGANTMVGNALGLNGAGGNTAATEAFQAGPGYQFAVDQSLQAAQRGAAAGGMNASGNTLMALQDRGNQLANQEYGGWLQNLIGQSSQGLGATGQQGTALTNQAGQVNSTLGNRLGLDASVIAGITGNRNNAAQAQEQGLSNMLNLGGKFLGFL